MSSSNSSFTSSSYVSFSSSSSSSSTFNGQRTGQSYTTQTSSDPRGTTVRTTSQALGGPAVEETKHYDHTGRQLLAAPLTGAPRGRIEDIEVEDVTESEPDQRYREAMEDEYAKREGGA